MSNLSFFLVSCYNNCKYNTGLLSSIYGQNKINLPKSNVDRASLITLSTRYYCKGGMQMYDGGTAIDPVEYTCQWNRTYTFNTEITSTLQCKRENLL